MKRIWIDSLDVNLKSALRNRKFAIILVAMLFTLCSSAERAAAGKIFRIGFLERKTASGSAVLTAFREEMSKLGWIEGKKISRSKSGSQIKN